MKRNEWKNQKVEHSKMKRGKWEHTMMHRALVNKKGVTLGTSKEEDEPKSGPGRAGGDFDWTSEVAEAERLWTSVFEEASAWEDCRRLKATRSVTVLAADFRHRETAEEVWVDSFFVPTWVLEKLEEASDSGSPAWHARTEEDLVEAKWRPLFDKPTEWRDFRALKLAGKLSSTQPDFGQISGASTLSLADAAGVPAWVAAALREADESGSAAWKLAVTRHEEQWLRLFDEPSGWVDQRASKAEGLIRPAHPDFTNQRTQERLWLDTAENLGWVAARLQAADEGEYPLWLQAGPQVEVMEMVRPLGWN